MQLEYYLRCFYEVAKNENMTKAAEELHIAQSAVSKMIKNIERSYEMDMFDRVGKNIVLNDNGRVFFRYTEKILTLLDSVRDELQENNCHHEKIVTVWMKVFSKFLPDIIMGFKKLHPDIKLIIMQHEMDNRDYDIALEASLEYSNQDNVQTLFEEKVLLAIPHNNPLAQKNKLYMRDLKTEKFITLKAGSNLYDVTNKFCQKAGFMPHIILESDTPATLRGILPLELGLIFVPELAWKNTLAGSNVLREINDIKCVRYVNLVLPKREFQKEEVKCFRKYIVDFFDSLQKTIKNDVYS